MTSSSTRRNPPDKYPFSPFLSSADPLKIFPDASIDLPELIRDAGYYLPHLTIAERERIVSYIQNKKVVDPLNLVIWGASTSDEILSFISQIRGWHNTLFSSPFWGLADAFDGTRQRVATVDSREQATVNWARGVVILTRIANFWARHHVRIFEPVFAGDEWGYMSLVGAHTEVIRFQRRMAFAWHRTVDWHVARDQFSDSVVKFLPTDAFEARILPTEGQWQGQLFDGRLTFIDLSQLEQA